MDCQGGKQIDKFSDLIFEYVLPQFNIMDNLVQIKTNHSFSGVSTLAKTDWMASTWQHGIQPKNIVCMINSPNHCTISLKM